jgi:hypothetical protein
MQFTLHGAVWFFPAGRKFSAQLTFAILVQHAQRSYHPDTLTALAKKIIRSHFMIASRRLTGLPGTRGTPEKAQRGL